MTFEDILKKLIAMRCSVCDQRETPRRGADGKPICEEGDLACETVMELCDTMCEAMERQEERAGG